MTKEQPRNSPCTHIVEWSPSGNIQCVADAVDGSSYCAVHRVMREPKKRRSRRRRREPVQGERPMTTDRLKVD